MGKNPSQGVFGGNLHKWIVDNLKLQPNLTSRVTTVFGLTLWCIWYARNRVVFSGKEFSPSGMAHHALVMQMEVSSELATMPHLAKKYV